MSLSLPKYTAKDVRTMTDLAYKALDNHKSLTFEALVIRTHWRLKSTFKTINGAYFRSVFDGGRVISGYLTYDRGQPMIATDIEFPKRHVGFQVLRTIEQFLDDLLFGASREEAAGVVRDALAALSQLTPEPVDNKEVRQRQASTQPV